MTSDGDFLSGNFAGASAERAKSVLEEGWHRWRELADTRGYKEEPVPREPLDLTLGDPVSEGGLKLEVAVRDLPRGDDTKPGRLEWQQCAYNLNWLDLSPEEARSLVTSSNRKQSVPTAVFDKLARRTLKDSVRGQCGDWHEGALWEGQLDVQCTDHQSRELTIRLTGFAKLSESDRAYECQLYGKARYDTDRNRFTHFELVAAGQRSGRDEFNFRQDDLGPAPKGVAMVMHSTQ
jgi:hypothetical protein